MLDKPGTPHQRIRAADRDAKRAHSDTLLLIEKIAIFLDISCEKWLWPIDRWPLPYDMSDEQLKAFDLLSLDCVHFLMDREGSQSLDFGIR